jgi:hypothetical protein
MLRLLRRIDQADVVTTGVCSVGRVSCGSLRSQETSGPGMDWSLPVSFVRRVRAAVAGDP